MTGNRQSFREVAADVLYSACCAIFLLALAYNHFKLITFETPLDYNEAGMLTVTGTIAAGSNPYSPENHPTNTSVYPPLYNIVVAPLTGVFGNSLVLHRSITALFILASCLLCFTMSFRESRSFPDSVAAACLFYAGLLYYSTPIAGPNGIGLFLFLASILVPWLRNFSNRSPCLAIVLGMLAFYAKQYFVASLGFIALYLFLAVSKMKGLIFGICSLILFLLVLFIVHVTSPNFLGNTIFAQGAAAALASSSPFLVKQWIEFGQIYLPVLLILGMVLLSVTLGKQGTREPDNSDRAGKSILPRFDIRDMRAPLISTQINYVWHCFFCSLFVITLSLGKNPGNHLTYFFQLLSPFLIAGTVAIARRAPKFRWFLRLFMLVAFYKTYAILQHDFSINTDNWQKIKIQISTAEDIYASPILLPEILRSGKEHYENGHTRYVVLASNTPDFLIHTEAGHTPAALWSAHVNRIRQKLKKQEFDLILLDQWMALPEDITGGESTNDLLKKYYSRGEIINLPLAQRLGGGSYAVRVWRPTPNLEMAPAPKE